jgi:uncharacterized membrane protein YfcA
MPRKSRHVGGPPSSQDPYLGDRNVREAASLQIVGMTVLGALLGFAAGGWFDFSLGLGAGLGALIGFVLGNVFLSLYGGRQTR